MIRKHSKRTAVFVLLSLLIHFAAVLSLVLRHPQPSEDSTRVEVEFVTPAELTPPDDKTALKRPDPTTKDRDQIVEQIKQVNDEVDQQSRFLSAFNQKVIKQTRADRAGKFNNSAKGGKNAKLAKSENRKEKESKETAKAEPQEPGEIPELKDLAPKYSMDPGPPADENGEVSQTDDYLRDMQSGLQTLLSTREFVYYSYYNRIKDALRQHWEPNVREKVKIIYRQGRSIASAKDRVTQVLVTLDGNGELIKVEVLLQSGVADLDNAAVEAFRQAAPFPNPPKGMIESDGTIKIRWDFVLEA